MAIADLEPKKLSSRVFHWEMRREIKRVFSLSMETTAREHDKHA